LSIISIISIDGRIFLSVYILSTDLKSGEYIRDKCRE